jgi:hypothetical protein
MRVRPALFAFAFAFSFALAAAPPKAKANITVNVPVEFKNLNAAVTTIDVTCKLTGKDPITLAPKNVGDETRSLRVLDGNYTGPSPVTFIFSSTSDSGSDSKNEELLTATGGSCEFGLVTRDSGGKPTAGDTRPVFAQQPGTPFKQKVTFTFP